MKKKIVLFRNGRLNLALIYFHRYIRLTPLLAVCILLSVSLFRFTGSGPLWPRMNDVISAQCKQNWWATLLYIQNYSHPDDMVSEPKDAFNFNNNNNNKKQIMGSIVLYLRVVPCCWYATLFFRTSRCLFDLSIQNKSDLGFDCSNFGLRWLYFGRSRETRFEDTVSW